MGNRKSGLQHDQKRQREFEEVEDEHSMKEIFKHLQVEVIQKIQNVSMLLSDTITVLSILMQNALAIQAEERIENLA